MTSFQEFGLNPKILQAISDLEFITPTPVQSKVIPLFQAEKRDIIALAQTGTGKTAAFGLPIMQMIDVTKKHTQALILSPTRELCMQICNDLMNFAKYMDNLNITAIYGGASIVHQMRQLERGTHIIVATPGRMVDLLKRRKADISKLQWFVLDEADEMLNMGFKDDIDTIFEHSPVEKNTMLFSATMAKEVSMIAKNYMRDPIEVVVGTKNSGSANVEHVYYRVHANDKYAVLKRVVDFHPNIYGLIFCRTKVETQEVADNLMRDGYSADVLHGDLSQAQRDNVMKKFRSRGIQMLVATDVAARGIDVDDLTYVINYNLPDDVEQYTHRSGRTGRAGKSGVSISLISPKDEMKIRRIEKQISKKITLGKVPTGAEVCERKLVELIESIKKVEVKEEDINPFLPQIMAEFEELSREDLVKKFMSVEFNRFLDYYKNNADMGVRRERSSDRYNDDDRRDRGRRDDGDRRRSSGHADRFSGRDDSGSDRGGKTVRMFINLGSMDGLDKESLKDFFSTACDVKKSKFVSMDIAESYTFFDVDAKSSGILLESLSGQRYNRRAIRIDMAERKNSSERRSKKRY